MTNIVEAEFARVVPQHPEQDASMACAKMFANGIAFALEELGKGKGRRKRLERLWADLRAFRDPWTITPAKVVRRAIDLLHSSNVHLRQLDAELEAQQTKGPTIRLPTGYTLRRRPTGGG